MKTTILSTLSLLFAVVTFAQSYSSVGGIETPYKGKYTFTCKLDEKTKTLSFVTNAPVTVVTLETYTEAELIARTPTEYTNTHKKAGNTYSYDLKQSLLKDKHAYWLKVSIGNNGIPLAEYFFKKTTATATAPVEEATPVSDEEIKNADGATVIKTNIKCAAGKTKVINALKGMDGVEDVKVDIATGKLTIRYSTDGTPYTTILSTINENGFDANGQKSANASTNPCQKKTSN